MYIEQNYRDLVLCVYFYAPPLMNIYLCVYRIYHIALLLVFLLGENLPCAFAFRATFEMIHHNRENRNGIALNVSFYVSVIDLENRIPLGKQYLNLLL
mmetsp:Transcript_70912/g.107275  ORF Transcript_70912/g.107275 Transcript_70912/m.107275 type:complete len:98 (-) Transcript_70912:151-444(-)